MATWLGGLPGMSRNGDPHDGEEDGGARHPVDPRVRRDDRRHRRGHVRLQGAVDLFGMEKDDFIDRSTTSSPSASSTRRPPAARSSSPDCHLLTYLFQCSRNGVVVESYRDAASGTLGVEGAAGGHFTEIVLRPEVTISAGDPQTALELHAAAHQGCYIGSSVNFPVRIEPTVVQAGA
jgi:hypothetical protein